MKSPFLYLLVASAAALTIAGCGGGGGIGAEASLPAADLAPAVAPATAPAPANVALTWKDADCSHTGTALPACSEDFSDNDAHTTVVTESAFPAIQLATGTTPAITLGHNNDIKGNKAIYGLNFLHEVKLSEFPGISYAMKLDTGAGSTNTPLNQAYNNYVVSLTCDGNNWLNLVTEATYMASSAADSNGYVTYTAAPDDVKWFKSGSAPFPTTGTPLLNGAIGTNSTIPLSLTALIAAYPNACLYNFVNSDPAGLTPTPAVMFSLSSSGNVTSYKYWIKNINIGTKAVF
ncbi:MAG: hypothetical protein ABI135_06200 [Rhodoferax sp.]